MRYLLDTNIVSNLVRNPHGRVAGRVRAMGEQNVYTSIIVAAELRHGTTKKASPRLSLQVEAVLGAIDTLPFDSPADEIYGSIRTQLELAGTPIGGNDLLIGAQAMALDHTLVTDNDEEFARIQGLRVENWLRDKKPDRPLTGLVAGACFGTCLLEILDPRGQLT